MASELDDYLNVRELDKENDGEFVRVLGEFDVNKFPFDIQSIHGFHSYYILLEDVIDCEKKVYVSIPEWMKEVYGDHDKESKYVEVMVRGIQNYCDCVYCKKDFPYPVIRNSIITSKNQ